MSTKGEDTYTPRLRKAYVDSVVREIMKRRSFKNALQVARLTKIVVNIGVSEAREDARAIDHAQKELAAITGQHADVRRAKKSISNFKLRQGMPIGARVTMRMSRMYEFLDRLVTIAIPRIRDFQGLDPKKGFDGGGNYNLGLREQYVFPEIDLDSSDRTRGMNITICSTAKNGDEMLELLSLLGMPFKKVQNVASKDEVGVRRKE